MSAARSTAEDQLLGAMLESRVAIRAALDQRLEAEDFSTHIRGVVYMALRRIYAREDIVDTLSVANELVVMSNDGPDLLAAAGGRVGLTRLLDCAPRDTRPEKLVRQVRELAAFDVP